MLIAGAKGFAKEVLEALYQADERVQVAFYDDAATDLPPRLHERFPILRTAADAQQWLTQDARFALGVGNPRVRRLLAARLRALGGQLTTVAAARAVIGAFGNTIGPGCSLMSGAVLTSDITLGEGVLVNLNCTIGHDTVVHDYAELSPGVHLSGHVALGADCVLGTGAVVLPGICIGAGSIVGAGSVVTKDVAPRRLVVGVPAKVIRELP